MCGGASCEGVRQPFEHYYLKGQMSSYLIPIYLSDSNFQSIRLNMDKMETGTASRTHSRSEATYMDGN